MLDNITLRLCTVQRERRVQIASDYTFVSGPVLI